ncbi:uncharacterized protein K489DRAFT_246855 [Dissoconium aciculare CBS 342.82]|uniref:Uncharacterized protein n=1 Tax=Dissoconium aciculare CBS 342.82 TaxID=1314786 RepID=A0A6J3M1J0_9PEZI|nr:uncharacterized protein K489DRAFT_246855 [Dissoconium aciculare CBS 342.82]KAF1821364.1 hypothetical protein K489DRAFT_246855 [Dissoconium aciculare CBS 342.82]
MIIIMIIVHIRTIDSAIEHGYPYIELNCFYSIPFNDPPECVSFLSFRAMSGMDGIFPGDMLVLVVLWLSIISHPHHMRRRGHRLKAEGRCRCWFPHYCRMMKPAN